MANESVTNEPQVTAPASGLETEVTPFGAYTGSGEEDLFTVKAGCSIKDAAYTAAFLAESIRILVDNGFDEDDSAPKYAIAFMAEAIQALANSVARAYEHAENQEAAQASQAPIAMETVQ